MLIPADGYLYNTATADSDQTTPETDARKVPVDQNPALTIVKDTRGSNGTWGDGVFVVINENVEWRYKVTNTGNVTLTNVADSDNEGVDIDCDGVTNTETDHIIASFALALK